MHNQSNGSKLSAHGIYTVLCSFISIDMTRICKIKGFRGFVGGKDNDNIFDEGVVYEVKKIMGEIILIPIGKQPEFDGDEKIDNLCLEEIIVRGGYLLPTCKH